MGRFGVDESRPSVEGASSQAKRLIKRKIYKISVDNIHTREEFLFCLCRRLVVSEE